jgi:hypothetical protein
MVFLKLQQKGVDPSKNQRSTPLIIFYLSQAEFIASYGGYHVVAIASLQQLASDGHIRQLTVRPK